MLKQRLAEIWESELTEFDHFTMGVECVGNVDEKVVKNEDGSQVYIILLLQAVHFS